jgi:uncharacterized protein YjbI with pentapeptide repeats
MGIGRSILILLMGLLCWLPLPAHAASYLQNYAPPLSFSNADLVGQDFSGQMLRAAEFSNTNLEDTNFSDANLEGAVLSASVMTRTNLHGANLTNALVDQVKFVETDLSDAVLTEAILLRSTFESVKITGADFTDAILDGFQVKLLCQQASGVNSKTGIATRDSLGCR